MKTNLLTISFLFTIIAGYSQIIKPTRYNLDSLGYPTNKKDYKYIRVVTNYNDQPNLFIFTDYYKSEKIKMKAISTNMYEPNYEGKRFDYYENGNKKSEGEYKKNKINGKLIEWYENGNKKSEKIIRVDPKTSFSHSQIIQFWDEKNEQKVVDGNGFFEETINGTTEKGEIKNSKKQGAWTGVVKITKSTFKETYENGEFVSGISIDQYNIEHPYQVLYKKPEPKEGMSAFYQYIGKNYKMPLGIVTKPGEKPKLIASFNIDIDGKITDIKIIKDLGLGTGEEAIRILKKAPNWSPGINRGIPTKVSFRLPIAIQSSLN